MLSQTSSPQEMASLSLQVPVDQAASPQNVASQRSAGFLWTGLGFAFLMLLGLSACALAPLASQSSAKSSQDAAAVAVISSQDDAFVPSHFLPPIAGVRPSASKRKPLTGLHMSDASFWDKLGQMKVGDFSKIVDETLVSAMASPEKRKRMEEVKEEVKRKAEEEAKRKAEEEAALTDEERAEREAEEQAAAETASVDWGALIAGIDGQNDPDVVDVQVELAKKRKAAAGLTEKNEDEDDGW